MTEPEATPFTTHILAETEARLIAADAAWAREIAAEYGADRIDEMAANADGRGAPSSKLRRLYDDRDKALADWRSARGLTD